MGSTVARPYPVTNTCRRLQQRVNRIDPIVPHLDEAQLEQLAFVPNGASARDAKP
jgi:hypothetical protein